MQLTVTYITRRVIANNCCTKLALIHILVVNAKNSNADNTYECLVVNCESKTWNVTVLTAEYRRGQTQAAFDRSSFKSLHN